MVYRLDTGGPKELKTLVNWQSELAELDGFNPVLIGGPVETADPLNPEKKTLVDSIGHRHGPRRPVAAAGRDHRARRRVPTATTRTFTTIIRTPKRSSCAGGRRGLQYVPLTDGTYFINRWFATVESIPKTIVPIGYVGVVVSYYGRTGQDLSGQALPPRRARGRGRTRRSGEAARARASMPSIPMRATSFSCRPPTSCSTG